MKKTLWIVLFVLLVLPLTSHSIPVQGNVTLDYGRTGYVTANDENTNVNVTVDFGATFTFIDSLVFRFHLCHSAKSQNEFRLVPACQKVYAFA